MKAEKDDLILAGIISAAVAVIAMAICLTIYSVNSSDNTRAQAAITACVQNGGSWIVDGDTGECWQENLVGDVQSDAAVLVR